MAAPPMLTISVFPFPNGRTSSGVLKDFRPELAKADPLDRMAGSVLSADGHCRQETLQSATFWPKRPGQGGSFVQVSPGGYTAPETLS